MGLFIKQGLIAIIATLSIAGCRQKAFLPFAADLTIVNACAAPVAVTPIGRNAQGKFCLLPLLNKAADGYYNSRKLGKFTVQSSATLSLQFDHDDVQFSGFMFVEEETGGASLVETGDSRITTCCHPPLETTYVIPLDCFKKTLNSYQSALLKEFQTLATEAGNRN
ncbi:MAG: hypothetical protein ACR2IE_12400 [Candidatus Sumerlaeaceae bacterium]